MLSARDDHYTTETEMKFTKAVKDGIRLLSASGFYLNEKNHLENCVLACITSHTNMHQSSFILKRITILKNA